MEAGIIYKLSSFWTDKTIWEEWIYCGIEDEVKRNVIEKAIEEYFNDTKLYFVSSRKDSFEINKSEIFERIENSLGKSGFYIWDTEFKKVIEFNKIGVMRKGFTKSKD